MMCHILVVRKRSCWEVCLEIGRVTLNSCGFDQNQFAWVATGEALLHCLDGDL